MTDPTKLTDEELNVKLAELRGYTSHDVKKLPHTGEDVFEKFWLRPGVRIEDLNADDICWSEGTSPPNYCSEDAPRSVLGEIERGLTDEQHYTFRCYLWEATDPKEGLLVGNLRHNRHYVSPTARQRAEALYLTLSHE